MRRLWVLAICLPLLAGCHKPAPQILTPPAGLNASQRINWNIKRCVRPIERIEPFYARWFFGDLQFAKKWVTIISSDGTALAQVRDIVGAHAYLSSTNPGLMKELTDRATRARFSVKSADGHSYTYQMTAMSTECDSVILKPVRIIPPQPYLDIRRLAPPQLAQGYEAYYGSGLDLDDTNLRLEQAMIEGVVDEPMSANSGLLFRNSDGSFIGYKANRSMFPNIVSTDTQPLMKFIEANSTVRFARIPEPKAALSDLYRSILAQVPPCLWSIRYSEKLLNATFLRSDGLALSSSPLMGLAMAKRTTMAMWDHRKHKMRFVRNEPLLGGALWLPVEKQHIQALVPTKSERIPLKPQDHLYTVDYDTFAEIPVVHETSVTAINNQVLLHHMTRRKNWVFTADGKPLGIALLGKGVQMVLLRLDDLQRMLATAK